MKQTPRLEKRNIQNWLKLLNFETVLNQQKILKVTLLYSE